MPPLFREALEIWRAALPAGHPDIALGLNVFVVAVLAFPADILYRLSIREKIPNGIEWTIVGLSFFIVFSIIPMFVFFPIQMGIRSLKNREI